MSVYSDAQTLDPGAEIRLYDIDLSTIGGGIMRFVPGTLGGPTLRWRGNQYVSLPVEATGFERSAQGTLPTPTLRIARNDFTAASVIAFNDLRGAKVVRWRTLVKFLDGQSAANPNEYWPVDIFDISRKVHHNELTIEFELAASIDRQGRKIPNWIATRDYCPLIYRHWTGSGFSYDKATCPYVGTAYFTRAGTSTSDPTQDQCGKKFSNCTQRFGQFAELPYGGFPGISRQY